MQFEHLRNGRFEGKVIQLLSLQFIYETREGYVTHCMFYEEWKDIEETNDNTGTYENC